MYEDELCQKMTNEGWLDRYIPEENIPFQETRSEKYVFIYKACQEVVNKLPYQVKNTSTVELIQRVKDKKGMTNEDVIHELYYWLVYYPCDGRDCTKKYREHWIDNVADYSKRKTHQAWIRIELKSMLLYMVKDKVKLSKEDYLMFIDNDVESKKEVERLLRKVFIVASSPIEYDLLRWRLGNLTAEDIMIKYEIKSRKTINNKWNSLKEKIHDFDDDKMDWLK